MARGRSPNRRRKKSEDRSKSRDSRNGKKDVKRRRAESERCSSRDKRSPDCPVPAPAPAPVPVITLDYPIKSPNDPKLYKVIQLGNGLKALLISDILCQSAPRKIRRNRDCVDLQIARFNRDIVNPPPGADSKQIEEDEVADSEPSSKEKPEHEHAPKCSCEHQPAAVALCVGGGSLHEPSEVEGLAHLCEHMIFCGTAKYPEPSQLDLYLAANGGITNGRTHSDNTIFSFHVNQGNLLDSLDMFANFFQSPLMSMKFLVKEKEVVNQEFNYKKCNDDEKRAHVLMQTGKKGHPVTRFSWGNEQTLRTRDGKDETLHKLLHQFRNQYYGSESMHLVIQASETLETLQEFVVQHFESIPRSSEPKPELKLEPMPFDTPEFRKFYCVIPTQDFNLLYATWEFPPEPTNYQSKPLSYIQRILSSEYKGGLSHYLRKKNLISAMTCSFAEMVHENTSCSTLFHISFNLINIGADNVEEIMEAFFSYMKFLVRLQPQEWYFNEFKSIRATEFHYLDGDSAIGNVVFMAKCLNSYGPKDCAIGDLLITKWEPALIQQYLEIMVPDKANYMLLSQAHSEATCNQTEPYFGTKYGVEDIPCQTMTKWLEAEPEPEFRFPRRNEFLTTNFCLVKNGGENDETPEMIHLTDRISMWHQLDSSDAQAEYRFLFMSPAHLEDVESFSCLSLWARFLERQLISRLYGANEAKIIYSAYRTHTGIVVEVQGFSQKLGLLVTEITRVIGKMRCTRTSNIDEALFNTEKSILRQQLKNEITNPELLARQLRNRVMLNTCYTPMEMHQALKLVTTSDFDQFCQNFLNSMFVIGYCNGNISASTARRVACETVNVVNYRPIPHKCHPNILSMELPLGESILRVRSLDKNNCSSIVSAHYQIGSVDLKSCLIGQLLVENMKEHAFQRLRVEKNLGYKVDMELEVNIASNVALVFTVISQSHEFTGTRIKDEMDIFLQDFYKTRVEPMTQDEFKKMKEGFGYIQQDIKEFFKEIIKEECLFDRSDVEHKKMGKLKLEEFQTWYETYLLPSCNESRLRKLVVQAVGSADQEYPVEVTQNWKIGKCQTAEPGSSPLVILLPTNASDRHIKDIEKFHANLPVLPKHKLL